MNTAWRRCVLAVTIAFSVVTLASLSDLRRCRRMRRIRTRGPPRAEQQQRCLPGER